MVLIYNILCVVRFWHNWIVGGCAVKRQFTTNMSVLLNAQLNVIQRPCLSIKAEWIYHLLFVNVVGKFLNFTVRIWEPKWWFVCLVSLLCYLI